MAVTVCVLLIVFASLGQTFIVQDIFKIISNIPLANIPPTRVDESDVTFYFFDRNYPTKSILITNKNWNIINSTKPTVYIVHGWTESRTTSWYRDMTAEYLIKDDLQVIQVDWKKPASTTYPESAQNTRGVGKIIAKHVLKSHIHLNLIHLIGHSLGGQVVGFAGKHIQELSGGDKVNRITGLDAAGPLFLGYPETEHLSPTDAVFVDSVHTDSGIFGYAGDNGKVDFYPDGGKAVQPGCPQIPIINIDDVTLAGDSIYCSHYYSLKIWIATINTPKYIGTKCKLHHLYTLGFCTFNEKVIFGESVSVSAEGRYFFNAEDYLI